MNMGTQKRTANVRIRAGLSGARCGALVRGRVR